MPSNLAERRAQGPRITVQIPPTPSDARVPPTAPAYWYQQPMTAATLGSNQHPYMNPFFNHHKASEFMFKQLEGFKDFTKSGLSYGERFAFWFISKIRTWSKKWFTHIFLFLCLLCYSGIGAVVFTTCERSYYQGKLDSIMDKRLEFAEELLKMPSNPNIVVSNYTWKLAIAKKLEDFEEFHVQWLQDQKNKPKLIPKDPNPWTFWNAMFFAGTVYTTIGYGHISPKTTPGMIATIIYATIGIPLFLIVLADFGKLLTRIMKFLWAFVRRLYYTGSCRKVRKTVPMQEMMKGLNIVYDAVRRPSQMGFDQTNADPNLPPPLPPKPKQDAEVGTEPQTPAISTFEIDDEFNVPITLAIVIQIVYILLGAFMYSCWEEWTFFQSFYFVFTSMTTIGFGDFVPNHPMFMMCSILYLVFGLALTSMCINVVQVKLSDTFSKASAKIGATIGFRVAEEDGALVSITPDPVEVAPVHGTFGKKKDKNDD